MISLFPKFHGLDFENPSLHFKEFEEVCATFHDQSCNEETSRLKLFHFSLKDSFPIHRTNAPKRQIMNFSQKDNETFYQCWERFKY